MENEGLVERVRREISDFSPDIPLNSFGSIREQIAWSHRSMVMASRILNVFALVGIAMAAIGTYGVVSRLVARRKTEFGIRMAIGASPREVMMLVMRQGFRLAIMGAAIGTAGALILGRWLQTQMPRLATPDLLTLASTSLLLMGVSCLACWIPARRTTRVDPLAAMRAE